MLRPLPGARLEQSRETIIGETFSDEEIVLNESITNVVASTQETSGNTSRISMRSTQVRDNLRRRSQSVS